MEIPNELNLVFNRLDGKPSLLSMNKTNSRSFLAWQEPHNEQHIIETSRSTTVIPVEHSAVQSSHIETGSLTKYLEENTKVSDSSWKSFR